MVFTKLVFGLLLRKTYVVQLSEDFIVQTKRVFGEHEAKEITEAISGKAKTSIRLHPQKLGGLAIPNPVPWTEYGYWLDKRPVFTLDPIFHGGGYYVQDASSMFLEYIWKNIISELDGPIRVLDLCASPGGKSSHLVSMMGPEDLLVSNEVIASRVNPLRENLIKWGYPNVMITSSDPSKFSSVRGAFDVIVVDAPCSGEGLFRKDKNAIREWSTDHVELCVLRQRRILEDIWPCLKEGGILIYSTCTFNDQENEENVNWLCEEFSFESMDLDLPTEWNVYETETFAQKGYKFLPNRTSGEGFFASVLRKTTDEVSREPKWKNPELVKERFDEWFNVPEDYLLTSHNDLLKVKNELTIRMETSLSKKVRIMESGAHLGDFMRKKKFVPSPNLPFSILAERKVVNLTYEDSLRFLSKQTISPEVEKGWQLFGFKGVGYGMGNVLPNRMNNNYPKEWRIRMDFSENDRFTITDLAR